ncbi:hypothetical protein CCR75_007516 [Bremia lactucae]|uniref:Crinkler effector protein N-terminal domain-containing protein n=1 Tax=Bremia lactucae TaxID=4779 RepID=A0A976FSR8_BRELC|nr:hypothetical protein CCR75_007516 [Bremia lactucae]
MVKLLCALVGEGTVFSVDIDGNKLVGDLQYAIKKNTSNKIKCSSAQLKLYLARRGDAWLSDSEPSALQLIEGNVDDDIEIMISCKPIKTSWPIQDCLDEKQLPAPQLKQIHVLVVVPIRPLQSVPQTFFNILTNDSAVETVERYEAVAKTLARTEEVESLSKTIRTILEGNFKVTPFVVLENSSGTGKTQMAFNLDATGRFDVFYIWCAKIGDSVQQEICKAYVTRSDTFGTCLNTDFKMTKNRGDGTGGIVSLQRTDFLYLYGFIHAALLGKKEVDSAIKTRNDVEKALEDRATSGKKPFIFFLDEFPRDIDRDTASSDHQSRMPAPTTQEAYDHKRRLRLMLNVFRSFGLVVIASSTSGTARTSALVSSGSRTDSDYLWCTVHPLFPRTVIGCDIGMLPTVIQNIIANSRPLFTEIALEYMRKKPWSVGSNTVNYLNALVGHSARIFAMMKGGRPLDFKIGQLCLLLCSSYRAEDGKANLIDGHYACLDEQKTFGLMLNGTGHLYKVEGEIEADKAKDEAQDKRTWECRNVFPHPANDVLLHLTLTGGKSYRPFYSPLREVLLSMSTSTMYLHDSNEPMNDGQRLEALVSAAVVMASHVDGLGGVALTTFLGRLLVELGVSSQDEKIELPLGFEIRENWVVPFLSPPNVEWPAWLLHDESMQFDNLVRTANGDTIDFRIDSGLISVECKDHKRPLSLETIKEILLHVPADSKVHFIVTRSLRKHYFTKKDTYATFLREHNLPTMDIYHVSYGSTLKEIVGMENQESQKVQCMDDGSTKHCEKKLVIFIEIGNRRI